MKMISALSARFSRVQMVWMAVPLCLAAAGCGNSISPTNAPASTAVTVALTANPTMVTAGNVTTLSAIVTNAAGAGFVAPTGSVTFSVGGTVLGTGSLAANPDGISATATLSESAGAFPVQPGVNAIIATYGGDTFHQNGASNTVNVTVTGTTTGVATSTTLSASATTITTSQSTILTASVTAQTGNTAPMGTVSFINQSTSPATTIASVALNPSSSNTATVSFSVSGGALMKGGNAIIAQYVGSSQFAASASSPPITVTVSSGATGNTASSTTLTASANSIPSTGTTLLTATVGPASGTSTSTPTGTVTFVDQTNTTTLGNATLSPQGTTGTAVASFTASGSAMASGANLIVAQYSGDSTFGASTSASVTVTVSGISGGNTTTTTITANPMSFAYGSCTQLSIQVAGTVTDMSEAPTGAVNLVVDGKPLGTATVAGFGGVSDSSFTACSNSGTALGGAGTYTLVGNYVGDSNYAPSTNGPSGIPLTVTGNTKANTTLDLSATSSTTIALGSCGSVEAIPITVAQPNGDPPTGTVNFFIFGTTQIGSANLTQSGNGPSATLNFCTGGSNAINAKGSYTITSTYAGDSNYNSSNSNGVQFTVN